MAPEKSIGKHVQKIKAGESWNAPWKKKILQGDSVSAPWLRLLLSSWLVLGIAFRVLLVLVFDDVLEPVDLYFVREFGPCWQFADPTYDKQGQVCGGLVRCWQPSFEAVAGDQKSQRNMQNNVAVASTSSCESKSLFLSMSFSAFSLQTSVSRPSFSLGFVLVGGMRSRPGKQRACTALRDRFLQDAGYSSKAGTAGRLAWTWIRQKPLQGAK
jgi:hypothetical protein